MSSCSRVALGYGVLTVASKFLINAKTIVSILNYSDNKYPIPDVNGRCLIAKQKPCSIGS